MKKWLLFLMALLMVTACGPDSKKKTEICNDGIDNDGDGKIDCADAGCYGQAGGPEGQLCQSQESRCNDGFDNDGDGISDCADADCATSSECSIEICDNGIDDDGDNDVDCDDADCSGNAACSGEICNNGTDDDGDGDVDCDDADCNGASNCAPVEICNDGIDNDSDSLIDCADSDCLGQQGNGGICQATETNCSDEFDNDGDGSVDCADSDCSGSASCQNPVEVCDNGTDDDGDGKIDCADPECNGQTGPGGGTCQSTEAACTDNYDNDGDGNTDCSDSDCAAACITPGAIVITEIMKDPNVVADGSGEWFEVTNTTSAPIDLRGLVIYSNSSNGEETHVIASANPVTVAPGAFLVLGISGDPLANGNVTVNYVYTTVTLANTTDDVIGLRTAGGTIIDAVSISATTFPNFAGMSLSLDRNQTNATANDNAANWCPAKKKYNTYDMGSPGAANPLCAPETNCNNTTDDDFDGDVDCADFDCANASNCSTAQAPQPGDLIVTEIMANPGVGTPNYQYEWFEVLNTTAQAVELNGLTICDDSPTRYCFPVHFNASTPLAAGQHAIFVSDPSLWTAYTGIYYAYGPAIQLNNSADAVQIFRGTTLIDAVSYDSSWPFSTAGVAVQFSSGTAPTEANNDLLANWCTAVNEYDTVNHLRGTPGAANRNCNASETVCNDNLDNDFDGLIDCADPNCAGQTGSSGETCETAESTCSDGFDNDADGLTDCADPTCAGQPGPGGTTCPASSTVDLTGYYVELYQNGTLVVTYHLNGVYAKGKYIVLARDAADLGTWTTKFSPALTAAETANIVEYYSTGNTWQMNHDGDDSAKLYAPGNILIDTAANPANKIRTRQADGTFLDRNTTDGALNAPNSIVGYSHPVYLYEIAEAASTIRLTGYQGNYVMLYIPNN